MFFSCQGGDLPKKIWSWSALGLLTARAPMLSNVSSQPGGPSSVGTAFFKEVSAAVLAKFRARTSDAP